MMYRVQGVETFNTMAPWKLSRLSPSIFSWIPSCGCLGFASYIYGLSLSVHTKTTTSTYFLQWLLLLSVLNTYKLQDRKKIYMSIHHHHFMLLLFSLTQHFYSWLLYLTLKSMGGGMTSKLVHDFIQFCWNIPFFQDSSILLLFNRIFSTQPDNLQFWRSWYLTYLPSQPFLYLTFSLAQSHDRAKF